MITMVLAIILLVLIAVMMVFMILAEDPMGRTIFYIINCLGLLCMLVLIINEPINGIVLSELPTGDYGVLAVMEVKDDEVSISDTESVLVLLGDERLSKNYAIEIPREKIEGIINPHSKWLEVLEKDGHKIYRFK